MSFRFDRDISNSSLPLSKSSGGSTANNSSLTSPVKILGGSTGALNSVNLMNFKRNSANFSTTLSYQTLPNRRTLKNAKTFVDR